MDCVTSVMPKAEAGEGGILLGLWLSCAVDEAVSSTPKLDLAATLFPSCLHAANPRDV